MRITHVRTIAPLSRGIWILVLGVFCGCSSYPAVSEFEQQELKKKEFLEQVVAVNGTATEKEFSLFNKKGPAWVIKLPGAKITDELVALIPSIGNIAELDLSNSTITDEQLLKLDSEKAGRYVLTLDLSGTPISDSGFGGLKNFYVMQKATLKGSKVTSAGVDRFKSTYNANADVPGIVKKGLKIEM